MKNTVNVTIKKGIVLILATLLLCSVTVGLAGCSCKDLSKEEWYKERYTEDFVYRRGHKEVVILGLTSVGKEKEVLIVPERIDNKPVAACYSFASDKLKKVYVPRLDYHSVGSPSEACENLEKIMCYQDNKPIGVSNNANGTIKAYLAHDNYAIDFGDGSNRATNYHESWINSYFANVSYHLGTGKYTYWIDDYAYGEKITDLPPTPQIKDATFVGWYKEPEWINEWDFDVDTLPEEIVVDGVVQYQETKLYAKVIKN